MNDHPDDHADDQQDEEQQQQRAAPVNPTVGAVGGWGISAVVHLAAVAIMWVVVFAAPKVEVEVPPTRINPIPPPPPKHEEKQRTDQNIETKVEITTPSETDVPTPVVAKVEVPVEQKDQPTETDNAPKGREEAAADSETGGAGVTMNIGAGASGGAGMMGLRTGASKKTAVNRNGGNRASEIAVEASLRWFIRHQSPNGSWDPEKYANNCTDGAKCEPGKYNDASGPGGTTVAVTAYSVLCFLGAGYDHQTPNKYRAYVKKGIDYLLSQQDKGGSWGRNYEHPIALMALAEAYAMTQDSTLQQPCQKALAHLLSKQNQDISGGRGLGWDYVGPNKRNDASTTGWNVMALKSCLAAGLNVGNGMEGAKNWLEKCWRASNHPNMVKAGIAFKDAASITVKDQSRFAYAWTTGDDDVAKGDKGLPAEVKKPDPKAKPDPNAKPAPAAGGEKFGMAEKPNAGHLTMECVGLVCGIFLGRSQNDPLIESLANTVMEYQMPGKGGTIYYNYYNTLSLFQLGGERWKTWNGKVRDYLVNSQEKTTDCKDGSWDPARSGTVGGIGRTITTAYNTLSLEVYYRYKQIQHH